MMILMMMDLPVTDTFILTMNSPPAFARLLSESEKKPSVTTTSLENYENGDSDYIMD